MFKKIFHGRNKSSSSQSLSALMAVDLEHAILKNDITEVKRITRNGSVSIYGELLIRGLCSENRAMHLFFKDKYFADKLTGLEGWCNYNKEYLYYALYNALNRESKNIEGIENYTSSKDMLSVGANPLLFVKNYNGIKNPRPAYFNLGHITRATWERLSTSKSIPDVYRKTQNKNVPFAASSVAFLATLSLFLAFSTSLITLMGTSLFAIAALATSGLSAFSIGGFLYQKNQATAKEFPMSKHFAWGLVDILAPNYKNDYISIDDLRKRAHSYIISSLLSSREFYACEVHWLFLGWVSGAKIDMPLEQSLALLGEYKNLYKTAFELIRNNPDATAANLPKVGNIKEEGVSWAFNLAKKHVGKYDEPKLEAKALQKLRVF